MTQIALTSSCFTPLDTHQIKQVIKILLPENPVILEAGAHEGGDTAQMAQLWPKATLYAFEPVPTIFERLKFKTQSYSNVHAFQLALSNTTGITKFFISSGDSDCSSSLLEPKEHLKYHPTVYFKNTIEVQTMTLDEWAQKNHVDHIDFMWLDMQGSELAMLKASPKIFSTVSVIYTEVNFCEAYKGCPLYPELRAWLESQGFVVAHEDLHRWVDFGDVLFVRKKQ